MTAMPPGASDVEIGRRVREARKAAGLSQAETVVNVWARFGLRWHQTAIGKIETGDRPLRLSESVALAAVLGVSAAWLVGEGEKPLPPAPDPGLLSALRIINRVSHDAVTEAEGR